MTSLMRFNYEPSREIGNGEWLQPIDVIFGFRAACGFEARE
jgi:hypothetical protein